MKKQLVCNILCLQNTEFFYRTNSSNNTNNSKKKINIKKTEIMSPIAVIFQVLQNLAFESYLFKIVLISRSSTADLLFLL